MEAEENPHELPQAAPTLPVFPQPNLYEQLMQDITENPRRRLSLKDLHYMLRGSRPRVMSSQ
jgi:hypothetical protein